MKKNHRLLSLLLSAVMFFGIIPFCNISASAASYKWAGSWGTPAIDSGIVLEGNSVLSRNGIQLKDYIPANSTIRATVTPTLGGTKIRLKFSNAYGSETVTLDEVTVGKTGETDDVIVKDSEAQITFNGGSKFVNIAPGSEVYSDEVPFSFEAMEKLSVSVYFRKTTPMYVVGLYGGTCYLASSLGNRTHKETVTAVASRLSFTSGSITYHTIPFLTRIDAYAQNAYCVVIAGDSTVTNDSYIYLAKKLRGNGINNVGVVMSGIIGNALLRDGVGLLGKVYGEAFISRFKRDVLNVAGAEYAIIKVGINDVIHPTSKSMGSILSPVTSSQVIEGYKELSRQAKDSGIKMYLCTRTPYKGYERNFMGDVDLSWSYQEETKLREINSWVRNTAVTDKYFSGCVDLDAMRDPKDSTKLRDHMTTDGAHFSDYGQMAFVDLLPAASYGASGGLTSLASILKIDPYTPPAAPPATQKPAEQTTAKPSGSEKDDNKNNNSNKNENTTVGNGQSSANTTVPVSPSGSNSSLGGTSSGGQNIGVIAPQVSTSAPSDANQILMDSDPLNSDSSGTNTINGDSSAAKKQLAGFTVLAFLGLAVIGAAAFMLYKMRSEGTGKSLSRTFIGIGAKGGKSRI